ncbi:tyrosine-type recombinase/integrase [Streptomyces mirabilis]|uniref:tyrosine-type recombinase/integrase n=1 Tax=Streptomyces mirabilis TaxID=68239 RepID=UPI00331E8F29
MPQVASAQSPGTQQPSPSDTRIPKDELIHVDCRRGFHHVDGGTFRRLGRAAECLRHPQKDPSRRRGGITDDPFDGVIPPEYIPRKSTIPTLDEIHHLKEVSSDELRVIIDLMSGCGHRNGEAYAANLERMVADDVCRITKQIDGTTRQRARLKHRKPGEFRETPMQSTVRESLLRYEKGHGADPNGYLLRTQRSPYWAHTTLGYQWSAAKKRAGITRKFITYSLRHFFASNCLSRGIPVTDVAEWMGHKNINMTFKIYRHLMPASIGRAAKLLNEGL